MFTNDLTFWVGIVGSISLVIGAAWPEKNKKTASFKSPKNWLFAIGGLIMLAYAILNNLYHQAPFFYIIFELFIAVTSILMMLDTDDRIDFIIVFLATIAFIIWSLFLFQGYTTIIFIIGLSLTGLGFSLEMQSLRRDLALTIGTILIAIFSLIVASWIFFWLNSFFALFSSYYLIKRLLNQNSLKKLHRIK